MEPLVGRGAGNLHALDLADAVDSPPPDADHAAGDEGLDLAGVAHHRELLLVLGSLREHAQVEQRAGAVVVVHDHIGAVENVGSAAVVALAEVVDHLAPRGVDPLGPTRHHLVHQVEEVAALLHESSAGVVGEAIPGPDLVQERETVLSQRSHPHPARRSGAHLLDEASERRHKAVLEPDPHQASVAVGGLKHIAAVGHGGAQGLLHQHVQVGAKVGAEHVVEHSGVGHVRGRDDHGVAEPGGQHLAVVREAGRGRHQRGGRGERGRVRVGQRRHPGSGQVQDVGDVLAAHHPGSDHPVAQLRRAHRPSSPRPCHGPASRRSRLSQIA